MKRVCSWCKTVMGTSYSATVSDDIVTHGICEKCVGEVRFTGTGSKQHQTSTYHLGISEGTLASWVSPVRAF